MTVLGSVFLGDAHHHRVFSTTPPTSPPPSSLSSSFPVRAQQTCAEVVSATDEPKSDIQTPLLPEICTPQVALESFPIQAQQGRPAMDQPAIESLVAEISPEVTLELRVRWLEALLLGIRPEATREVRKHAAEGRATKEEAQKRESLFRRAEDVQRRLDAIVTNNDGLKRFMEHYDEHAQFLTPSFALSGPSNSLSTPPTYSSMSSVEFDALLSEMEGDIRGADRDLREIDALEKRGVTGAGRLVDYKPLQPRLQALVKAHEEDLVKAASLENRIAALLEKHATKVDTLSELFVAWNDVITEAEDRVGKVERELNEQKRLGYE